MNGITYFKMRSPYEGDITKGCGLLPEEVDNNFYVLEGRDIKSVTVEDGHISIQLYNGDIIKSNDVFNNYISELSFSFDEENGVLTITQNGQTQEISGFKQDVEPDVITVVEKLWSNNDETINGNGTRTKPLSISPLYRTGQYKPVLRFIDEVNGDELPDSSENVKGDRYIVSDTVNPYGLLYNKDTVKQIACELEDNASEWRIPTKEDWDDMLNAIEPNEEDKEHDSSMPNKYLGKFAGRFLKTREHWINSETETEENNENETVTTNEECEPTNAGVTSSVTSSGGDSPETRGTDKYGFSILPSGYGDDTGVAGHFGDRAEFWTNTEPCDTNTSFIKRFDYNRNDVYQDIIPNSHYASIRLVKDYTGVNYKGIESILNDEFETVLMPSVSNGHQVWTSVNVALSAHRYDSIRPNGDVGDNPIKYYIVEWDGEQWLSSRFNEGDTVVILRDKEGKYNTEYRLINGELMSVREQTATDVLDTIEPMLSEINENVTTMTEKVETFETELSEFSQNLSENISQTQENTNSISALDNRVSDNETNIASLTERADATENKVNEIDGDLIQVEGTSYEPTTGVLTLKSKDSTNDISLQFSFNFGQI